MARKTPEEKLEELKQKRQALLAKERKIKAEMSRKERNARTKRLIEIGATMESALGHKITADMLPTLYRWAQRNSYDMPIPASIEVAPQSQTTTSEQYDETDPYHAHNQSSDHWG